MIFCVKLEAFEWHKIDGEFGGVTSEKSELVYLTVVNFTLSNQNEMSSFWISVSCYKNGEIFAAMISFAESIHRAESESNQIVENEARFMFGNYLQ